jgi:tetratricopeptide (TPR) repeat protein
MPSLVSVSDAQIKKRIVELMSTIRVRLRQQRINIVVGKERVSSAIDNRRMAMASLVEMIQNRGCDITPGRFSDIFLARPQHVVNARVDELITTFEVILEANPPVMSAVELLELCNLTRLPIGDVSRFAKYFSNEDWRKALQYYDIVPFRIHEDGVLLDRDSYVNDVVNVIMTAWRRQVHDVPQHVVISGPSGIGKSAVAMMAARRIEPLYAHQVFVVTVPPHLNHVDDVYRAIGLTSGMQLLGNETWLMRLRTADRIKNAVILLDDLNGNDKITPEHILYHLFQQLPNLHVIVTTQVAGLAHAFHQVHEIALPPLDEAQAHKLFWHVYRNADGGDISPEKVNALVTLTHGYPMHIVAVANSAVAGVEVGTGDMYRSLTNSFSALSQQLLRVMMMVRHPLSEQFWHLLGDYLNVHNPVIIKSQLSLLERRQIITNRRGEGYLVHDAMRLSLLSSMSDTEQQQMLGEISRLLTNALHAVEIEGDVFARQLTTFDVLAAYDLLRQMYDLELYDWATNLVVHWRIVWIRHGLSAELCTIANQLLRVIGEQHPAYGDVLFAIGSFYGHRGIVDSTIRYLNQAMTRAERVQQSQLWAMSALECGLHGLQTIGWQESERLILRALSEFEILRLAGWSARCYDTLSYIYLIAGQPNQSVKMSDEALKIYGYKSVSFGAADAHANRGLIFMVIGDYEMARNELFMADGMYSKLKAPSSNAAVHLRMAAVFALNNQPSDARHYITKAFKVLERIGGLNDLLYIVDVFAAISLAEGDGVTAVRLATACTMVRDQHGLVRGEALDGIVRRLMTYADMLAGDERVPPAPANLADLIMLVRSKLLTSQSNA